MNKKFCPNCESVAVPRKQIPGSFLIELFLFCLFVVPGLIYGLWRLAAKREICPNCGSMGMISITSPRALRMAKQK